MSSVVKTPGPFLQSVNAVLHKEPFSFLIRGIVWFIWLFIGGTLAGTTLLIITAVRLLLWLSGWSTLDIVVSKNKAVVITGCDSGFGKDLAFCLADLGFTVFCGCLTKDSFQQYRETPNTYPVMMDVTKQNEVLAVSKLVDNWLKESSERTLHALVNNAGVGHCGLIDWISDDLAAYKIDMEVNFYGMVRTTKAFLPILKRQVGSSHDSRIINMVSMAGLIVGPQNSPYNCSKFAAEAFSNCLRLEMKQIGIQVVTINPSFHETPLTRSMSREASGVWEALPAATKEEYGEEYFKGFHRNGVDLPQAVMWDATIVQQEMRAAVLRKHAVHQMIVGGDAICFYMLVRMLPPWIRDHLIPPLLAKPYFCDKKKVD